MNDDQLKQLAKFMREMKDLIPKSHAEVEKNMEDWYRQLSRDEDSDSVSSLNPSSPSDKLAHDQNSNEDRSEAHQAGWPDGQSFDSETDAWIQKSPQEENSNRILEHHNEGMDDVFESHKIYSRAGDLSPLSLSDRNHTFSHETDDGLLQSLLHAVQDEMQAIKKDMRSLMEHIDTLKESQYETHERLVKLMQWLESQPKKHHSHKKEMWLKDLSQQLLPIVSDLQQKKMGQRMVDMQKDLSQTTRWIKTEWSRIWCALFINIFLLCLIVCLIYGYLF